jgi:hypothetical protein
MTLTPDSLAQFCHRPAQWWRHPLYGPVLYSDGVRYVAEAGDAWWLVQIITATAPATVPASPLDEAALQVWRLVVANREAILRCDDGHGHLLYEHPPLRTDFPLPGLVIVVIEGRMMMLMSEYDAMTEG